MSCACHCLPLPSLCGECLVVASLPSRVPVLVLVPVMYLSLPALSLVMVCVMIVPFPFVPYHCRRSACAPASSCTAHGLGVPYRACHVCVVRLRLARRVLCHALSCLCHGLAYPFLAFLLCCVPPARTSTTRPFIALSWTGLSRPTPSLYCHCVALCLFPARSFLSAKCHGCCPLRRFMSLYVSIPVIALCFRSFPGLALYLTVVRVKAFACRARFVACPFPALTFPSEPL